MIIKGKVKDKKKKIIGRGFGSGKGGHTSTRGMKGQNSRSGSHISKYFEGGQNPLIKRLPYLKGFNRYSDKIEVLNLGFIDKYFNDGDLIDIKNLKERGFVNKNKVKILSFGELSKKFQFKELDFSFSKKALDKIKKSKSELI